MALNRIVPWNMISRQVNLFPQKSGAKHYWLHLYIYFLLKHPIAQALITKLEMKTLIEMLLFI